MFWAIIILAAGLAGPAQRAWAADSAATAKKPAKVAPKALTLDAFVKQVLSDGSPSRVPGPIAELIDVPKDVPIWWVNVSEEQSADGKSHLFQVMVERAPETGDLKPFGLVLRLERKWPGNKEGYWLRASLKGILMKTVLIRGKRDEQGKAIKGAGIATEEDIDSPQIKGMFQHELDLWLKRAYVKKAWRSAGFVKGELRKQ